MKLTVEFPDDFFNPHLALDARKELIKEVFDNMVEKILIDKEDLERRFTNGKISGMMYDAESFDLMHREKIARHILNVFRLEE